MMVKCKVVEGSELARLQSGYNMALFACPWNIDLSN
jgi:hypothetical protein